MKNYIYFFFVICSLLIANTAPGQTQNPNYNIITDGGTGIIDQEFNQHFVSSIYKNTNEVEVITMLGQLCFPYDISTDGEQVVISSFGSNPGFYWNLETGIIPFTQGSGNGISDNGRIGGTFTINVSGMDVQVAGYWEPATQEWTFLGENPHYPDLGVLSDYNSGWDITADGQTIVGLQFDVNFNAFAMQWNETLGYTDLGGTTYPSSSSRASGVSKDGSVIYGWTQGGQWNPTVWYNGEMTIVNTGGGEALCASAEGTYVGGTLYETSPNGSNKCFIWHKEDGTVEEVTNTLNNDEGFVIVGILEDKTCFGWTIDAWPPFPDQRRAFIRDADGLMQTFNDYAEARGLADAQDWFFYSVNAATPDGNVFIGTAQTPQGLDIGFYIDFNLEMPVYNLSLEVEPEGAAIVSGAGEYEEGAEVTISAEAIGYFEFDNWTNEEGDIVSEEAETSIVMPDSDYSLTANFHTTIGIDEVSQKQLCFFPNPAQDQISFEMEEPTTIRVMDMNGKLVLEQKLITNTTLDISNLDAGVYMVFMIGTNSSKHEQLIKK